MAKKMKLKILKTERGGQELVIDYKEMIGLVAGAASDGKGFSIGEIRQSVKILDRIEDAEDSLILEDTEYQYLLARLQNFRFSFAHKALVEFIDDLESAEDVELGK